MVFTSAWPWFIVQYLWRGCIEYRPRGVDGTVVDPNGGPARRIRRRRHGRRGRDRRHRRRRRSHRERARSSDLGHPGNPRGRRRSRPRAVVYRGDVDRSTRSRHVARRIDRSPDRQRDAGLGVSCRGGTRPKRRRRNGLRTHRGTAGGARYRDAGRRRDVRRFHPGRVQAADPRRFLRRCRRATRRDGRRAGEAGIAAGRPAPGGLGHRRRPVEAGAAADDVPRRECGRGAGDRAGPRGGAGVGERPAVRLLDRCGGLRARPRYRRGRPTLPARIPLCSVRSGGR